MVSQFIPRAIESNQPYLDSALRQIESMVADLLAIGVRGDRIAVLGFSQGACLTLEFVARHPRRYGAILGLTGGLIGPDTTREKLSRLAGRYTGVSGHERSRSARSVCTRAGDRDDTSVDGCDGRICAVIREWRTRLIRMNLTPAARYFNGSSNGKE